jgi:hypothetical protein
VAPPSALRRVKLGPMFLLMGNAGVRFRQAARSAYTYLRLSGLRDELTLDELSLDELSFAELSWVELGFEELSLDEPSFDEPSLDELSLDELSLDELSLDELSLEEPSDLDFSSFFASLPPPSPEGVRDLLA